MLKPGQLRLPLENDIAFFEREIDSFLPDKVFDAHTHSWRRSEMPQWDDYEDIVSWDQWVKLQEGLHPGRTMGGYFIPSIPEPELLPAANEWNAKVVRDGTRTIGIYTVKPDDDPEFARQEVKRLGLNGFKVYRTYALSGKFNPEASIPDFLSEPFVKVAHEEGWFITLHVFKKRAMADPENIHWVKHYCETYPNMKLILAHSARGFNPNHNLEGLPQLTHLDNLYFDTSANCESFAHEVIIRLFGHEKLMYGTDLPISHLRGRSFAVDDSFRWINEQTPIWDAEFDLSNTQPVFHGLEHLRSVKWACWSQKLTDSQVEDVFWNNAIELFGLK